MPTLSPFLRISSYRRMLAPTFWLLTVTIFVNDNLYETISVEGQSMAPTLSPLYHETGARDYILTRKHSPSADLRRGDVISFWSPVKPEKLVCKRVVGLEGDLVMLDRKRRPQDDVQARNWDIMSLVEGEKRGTVRVPWGHVWVEGDNWRKSADSNNYGPVSGWADGRESLDADNGQVSKSLITGKALFVLKPLSKFMDKPWEKMQNKTKVKHGEPVVPIEWHDL